MKLQDGFLQLRNAFREAGLESPDTDAKVLICDVAGIPRNRYAISLHDPLPNDAETKISDMIDARVAQRKPVSHITGKRQFMDLELTVSEAVLDPRPETELLVHSALETPFTSVLDLGTGSGVIALQLLALKPEITAVATDISPEALGVAQQNAIQNGLENRCRFIQSDWWTHVPDMKFELIVSNPPYIGEAEMPGLTPEVLNEPHIALTDFADGLTAYREIASKAAQYLTRNGRILVEIGPTQAGAVSKMFQLAGLDQIQVFQDMDGRDRVVSAQN